MKKMKFKAGSDDGAINTDVLDNIAAKVADSFLK